MKKPPANKVKAKSRYKPMPPAELQRIMDAFGVDRVTLAQFLDLHPVQLDRYFSPSKPVAIPVPTARLMRVLYREGMHPFQCP